MPLHSKETEVLGSEGFSAETPLVLKPHLHLPCPEGSSDTRPEARSMRLHRSFSCPWECREKSHTDHRQTLPSSSSNSVVLITKLESLILFLFSGTKKKHVVCMKIKRHKRQKAGVPQKWSSALPWTPAQLPCCLRVLYTQVFPPGTSNSYIAVSLCIYLF